MEDEPVIGFGDNLDVPDRLHDGEVTLQDGLSISFAGEAYETFQKLLQECKGYGVTLTTHDGERIEGVLVGPVLEDEWGDCVAIYPVHDGEDYETLEHYQSLPVPPMAVRVGDVHVH